MVRKIFKVLCVLFVLGITGPGFADIVVLKNGRTIYNIPKVLDTHGLFGAADQSPAVVPAGKVRLTWENGFMDIPAKEIKELKRE